MDPIDLEAEARTQAPGRRPAGVIVAVLAVLALVGVGIVTRDDGEVEVAVDEDEQDDAPATTVPEPDTAEDFQIDGPGLALGAPDDGKDSVGLPVDADPKTGLVDGQTVTVYGAQFPPNQAVGVVMCTREALREHGGHGVDACNIGHFAQEDSDDEGNVAISFEVRRLQTFEGQEIDCAAEAGRCIIGMGLLSDYDQSGGVEVSFDDSVALPDPPSIELSKTSELADGEQVSLRVDDLVPGGEAWVETCVDGAGCTSTGMPLLVGADGSIETTIQLWRTFGIWTEDGTSTRNADCAVESCRLSLYATAPGARAVPSVPLSFSSAGDVRTPPTIRLLAEGPFERGEQIDVEITGLSGAGGIELQSCSSLDGACTAYGFAEYDGPTATGSVRIDQVGGCDDACVLTAVVYGNQPGSDPPPLFPEPITFAVTG